jgi:hypothetical protein
MSSVHADEDEDEDDDEGEDSEDEGGDDDDESEDEDEEDGDCEDEEEVKAVLPKAVLPLEEPRNEPRERRMTLKAKIVDCAFSVL